MGGTKLNKHCFNVKFTRTRNFDISLPEINQSYITAVEKRTCHSCQKFRKIKQIFQQVLCKADVSSYVIKSNLSNLHFVPVCLLFDIN